ncbi:RNA-splicing factor [Ascosphaera acerosa]|nr:RNA-splicing factor [Ascosphaera acerosa]
MPAGSASASAASESTSSSGQAPVISFKKRTAKQTLRRKPLASISSPLPDSTIAESPLRTAAATDPASSSDDDDSDDDDDDDGNGRRRVKRQRKAAASATVTASSSSTVNPARTEELMRAAAAPSIADTRNAALNEATKTAEWFDEPGALGKDELLGTTRQRHRETASADSPTSTPNMPDGTYHGNKAYTSFIRTNPDRQPSATSVSAVSGAASGSARKFGPTKGQPSNVRTITITDFAPDVCKDYKLTGFCGFGDSCKFLHAREDYKQGWELDREWEVNTKSSKPVAGGVTVASAASKRRSGGDADEDGHDSGDEAELEDIPFACIICKRPYTNPVVTRCGHYFCESCALKKYRKSPNCVACGSGTGGVFNTAKRLEQLLKRKRERVERRRQAALEAGEDPNEDSDADDDDE